ncbi:hypothetical protein GCM10010282_38130 [Streptomyces roseolus]|nr:hypothetical protein GCM10010282_38130 [Streptomyces roseolus]
MALLDLTGRRTGHEPLGPAGWVLVSTAVGCRTTGAVSPAEYRRFCDTYGRDVADAPTVSAPGPASCGWSRPPPGTPPHIPSGPHRPKCRVDCLPGRRGNRPWQWKGIL